MLVSLDDSQCLGRPLRWREMEGSRGALRDAAHPGEESRTPRLVDPSDQVTGRTWRRQARRSRRGARERGRRVEGSSGP